MSTVTGQNVDNKGDMMVIEDDDIIEQNIKEEDICPMCGGLLVHREGCITCMNCFWTPCE